MAVSSRYLDAAVRELSRLPGIGPKSASRVAFHLLKMSTHDVRRLTETIIDLKEKITSCSVCGGISDGGECAICSDPQRETKVLCIVEEQRDLLTIERTGVFRGKYHVLGGVISPLDGVGPDDLSIDRLVERLRSGQTSELLIALNPTVEGDATALYISKMVKPLNVKVMRMARGLPVGAEIEYADSATIATSISDRVEIG
jgi:recombination protein RecR